MKYVKKYILYACVLASSLSLTSCDKDLNNVKKDVLTDATQWASEANADIAINDVYDQLPDIYGQPENFDTSQMIMILTITMLRGNGKVALSIRLLQTMDYLAVQP